jgi:hypothetical protein
MTSAVGPASEWLSMVPIKDALPHSSAVMIALKSSPCASASTNAA